MSILDDLISGASGDVPVSSLLKKVKVVAARARVPALAEWVGLELNGYGPGVELPAYRGPFVFDVVGHLAGPGGGQLRNAPIGSLEFPEDYRNSDLFRVHFTQPIVVLEDATRGNEERIVRWPANTIGLINGLIQEGRMSLYQDFFLQDAWFTIPRAPFVSIVEAVRNRILDLALKMQDTDPKLGQIGVQKLSPEISQSFITNIYSSSPNVAIASANTTQNVLIEPGDRHSLASVLRSLGVSESEIDALFEALADDTTEEHAGDSETNQVGPATSSWLARVMLSANQIGTGAAGGLIARALGQYLGLS